MDHQESSNILTCHGSVGSYCEYPHKSRQERMEYQINIRYIAVLRLPALPVTS